MSLVQNKVSKNLCILFLN